MVLRWTELQKSDNTANTNSQQDATNTEDTNQPQDTTRPENTNDLVTDLTNSLNNKEVNLLAKGPKFSLSPGINEQTTTAINIAFCRLANQIQWKQFRELNPQNPQHTDFLTYRSPNTSTIQIPRMSWNKNYAESTISSTPQSDNLCHERNGPTSATSTRKRSKTSKKRTSSASPATKAPNFASSRKIDTHKRR